MKSDHVKKFLNEVLLYLWIPLIVALVSYIFFQLQDMLLGIIALVALSAIYALARLYFMHKKWWVLVILVVVILGSGGIYFLRAPTYALTINEQKVTAASVSLDEGKITISPAPQGNGLYTKNAVVTLTADPASGYDWKGWTGTDDDKANPTTVTMGSNKDIKANFEGRYSLIINNQLVIGSFVSLTEGSVTVDPPPSDVDWKYTSGTKVNLIVHPNAGFDWQSWTGADNNNVNPTTVTMDGGKQITLAFLGRFELIVNGQTVTGPVLFFPEGSVAIDPAPDSDGKYASGTQVMLLAHPNQGYGWQNWTGTLSSGANPTTIVLNSTKHVMINWDLRFLVTINSQLMVGPTISLLGGTVTASPAPSSDGSYAKDTRVTFTATPAAGYRFGRWGGGATSTSSSITVTFNSDQNISAVFIKTYTLLTAVSPGGGGTISADGTVFDEGTAAILTATPSPGYRFDHWDGNAFGGSPTVSIIMDANKSVTAVFVKIYTLTVTVNATEGSVTPGSGIYDEGTTVTLTAAPATGYGFDHWEGDVTGTNATITFIMNGNKTVTAVFLASP